jgi:hypothetical protein
MPDRHAFETGTGIPPRCNTCNQPRSAPVHHTLCTIEVQPAEPWKPVAHSTPAVTSLDATDWPAACYPTSDPLNVLPYQQHRAEMCPMWPSRDVTLADLGRIQDAVWDGRD